MKEEILNGRVRERSMPSGYDLKKIWNPSWFQGNRKKNGYFEGWYFKSVTAEGTDAWAFIPGISMVDNDEHAFVQVLNGKTGQTWYFRYPLSAFAYSRNKFFVRVGDNEFSKDNMTVSLASGRDRFFGTLNFSDNVPYKASLGKPGIMGWYRYVPFMECYHGVVSLNHHVNGSLQINEQLTWFKNGKGYIEKDWGTSMPKAWIWMQSNHFEDPTSSFMMSIARIPWVSNSFTGFLGFLLHRGKRYDFATYNGAKIIRLSRHNGDISLVVRKREFEIEVVASKGEAGTLKAPVSGNMERIIRESINSVIHIKLYDANRQLLFAGKGTDAGLEIVGDQELLSDVAMG